MTGNRARLLTISLACMGVLSAQPCLVHGDPDPVSRMATFAGVVQPRLSPVEPGTSITVVLFPQTIQEEQQSRTLQELSALYKAAGTPSPLKLSVFDGQAFIASGPFPRLSAWQKAVSQAMSAGPGSTPALTATQFYPLLAGATETFGGSWNTVLLVGRLPEFEEDVRDYASAWFSSRVCSQHIRLNHWDPNEGETAFWQLVTSSTAGIAG